MMTEPFSVLGLPQNATKDEVKRAFHKLAFAHHPDRGGDAEKFKRISAAYSDAYKRAPVERAPQHVSTQYQTVTIRFASAQTDMYWEMMQTQARARRKAMEDMMSITLEDLARSRAKAEELRKFYEGNFGHL